MENKDLKEILGDGESEAKSRLGRLMPERPDRMGTHTKSEVFHSKEDMKGVIQEEIDKGYSDVTKKPDGKAAIKEAQKSNPNGLMSGVPVPVEYNGNDYKVFQFNVGNLRESGDKVEFIGTGKEWIALKANSSQEKVPDSDGLIMEHVDANIKNPTEFDESVAKDIVKAVARNGIRLKGNPPAVLVDTDDLIADGVLDAKDKSDGDTIYLVKDGKNTRVFQGGGI